MAEALLGRAGAVGVAQGLERGRVAQRTGYHHPVGVAGRDAGDARQHAPPATAAMSSTIVSSLSWRQTLSISGKSRRRSGAAKVAAASDRDVAAVAGLAQAHRHGEQLDGSPLEGHRDADHDRGLRGLRDRAQHGREITGLVECDDLDAPADRAQGGREVAQREVLLELGSDEGYPRHRFTSKFEDDTIARYHDGRSVG
ncbi:MAG: hypothetical protein IPO88_09535 [Nannocystis sp.]|uniref:hypothetical protein n=1 Tax=Nannocystis sp. TaxID=1962667 RepID=UPI002429A846|nr:hypothetical protein [Nannocystis sp.]MBK9753729.1 hypothetical protein [Nannocystis sp.]